MNYDIFISYRRKTGVDTARLLQQAFKARGYSVFFDYDSVRDGHFDERIYDAIKSAGAFVLVMTNGCLDACLAEEDWVRKEVDCALQNDKHIVPIAPSNKKWSFPKEWPKGWKSKIPNTHVSTLDMGELFEESVEKIIRARIAPCEIKTISKKFGRENIPPGCLGHHYRTTVWICTAVVIFISIFALLRFPLDARRTQKGINDIAGMMHKAADTNIIVKFKCSTIDDAYESGFVCPVKIIDGVSIEMVWCPPGNMTMGSPTNEIGRSKITDETLHEVRLSKGFWIAKYPVTQSQWYAVMGNNPACFKGVEFPPDKFPVEKISWHEGTNFTHRLSTITGKGFKLPTEAQWEYACRAGTQSAFYWGTNDLNGDKANCDGRKPIGFGKILQGRYRRQTTPVGHYAPNAWGIFDMSGNVYEWCADWYSQYDLATRIDPAGPKYGSAKVIRGGNWDNGACYCRSAARMFNTPDWTSSRCGIRPVCTNECLLTSEKK